MTRRFIYFCKTGNDDTLTFIPPVEFCPRSAFAAMVGANTRAEVSFRFQSNGEFQWEFPADAPESLAVGTTVDSFEIQ